jgi:hypothetical protein
MKKSVLALAMAFGVTSAFAQDLTSKKGEPILPEAGDWAISADATPFLNYFGKLFNSANQAPSMQFLNGQNVIMGKYFKDEKTAYRVGLNIGFGSKSTTNLVNQDNPAVVPAGTQPVQVTDKLKHGNTGIGLTAGIEKRKGKTRLQGYYGAEAGFYVSSTKDTYTYGNTFVANGTSPGTSTSPTSTDWNNPLATGGYGTLTGARTTQTKSGSSFQLGIRGFIGAEYFVLPKMSIGGEFGWGLGLTMQGAGTTTTENNFSGTAISTHTATLGKTTNLAVGTDNKNNVFGGPTGSLRLNMYF